MRFAKNMDGETNESTATGFIWDAMDGFAIVCSLSSQTLGPLVNNANYQTNPISILFSIDDADGGDGNPTMNRFSRSSCS